MANIEHLKILKQGVGDWNLWRAQNGEVKPDLSNAKLSRLNFKDADLSDADLSGADLSGTWLSGTRLSGANLTRANLSEAHLGGLDLEDVDLSYAILRNADLLRASLLDATLKGVDLSGARLQSVELFGANLEGANLRGADLSYSTLIEAQFIDADLSNAELSYTTLHGTNFRGADLSGATLENSVLVDAHLEGAIIVNCSIYGIAAWNVGLEGTKQSNLNISRFDEPTITVDNLEVAQFIYLLLNNKKIREVIDTVTTKVVLILGRFTPERKAILDALREELRKRDYLPVLFDFDKPSSRNLTETVSTIAHMARFVIADITDAKSIPQELQRIVPSLPSVPVQPIIHSSFDEYGMFRDLLDYHTVLTPHIYDNMQQLLASLESAVIAPAEMQAKAIIEKRAVFEKKIRS